MLLSVAVQNEPMRTVLVAMAAALIAASLGGCAEESQSLAAAKDAGFKTDSWNDQLRERTSRQGESARIYP